MYANGTNGTNGTLFVVNPHSRVETSCEPEINLQGSVPSVTVDEVGKAAMIRRLLKIPGVRVASDLQAPPKTQADGTVGDGQGGHPYPGGVRYLPGAR